MKKIVYIVASLLFILILFFGVMTITEYRPSDREIVSNSATPSVINKDTIKMVSWNIGYAGLGDDMDFFYDGGKSTRTSHDRTDENLREICNFLKKHSDADFVLLQEIDKNSKRSFYINQYDTISKTLKGFNAYFAYNYKTLFVPIPVTSPMGPVESGLAIFSKAIAKEAIRYQYPGSFSYPVSLFNLKRALLETSFEIEGGGMLYINNTHNSAFDDGNMRRAELSFLDSLCKDEKYFITMGDWNSNPPSYKASLQEQNNKYFSPLTLKESDFLGNFIFSADTANASARYGYEPFNPKTTTRTVLDFAIHSPLIKLVSIETIDLKFKNSDHNPVVAVFVISRK